MDNGAQYSESLARLRTRTIEQCLEAQRRSRRRLVFALDTALSLQGIELLATGAEGFWLIRCTR